MVIFIYIYITIIIIILLKSIIFTAVDSIFIYYYLFVESVILRCYYFFIYL